MAETLKSFLEAVSSIPHKQVKRLYIDDCQMTDEQFSKILQGIQSQDQHVNSITYNNN